MMKKVLAAFMAVLVLVCSVTTAGAADVDVSAAAALAVSFAGTDYQHYAGTLISVDVTRQNIDNETVVVYQNDVPVQELNEDETRLSITLLEGNNAIVAKTVDETVTSETLNIWAQQPIHTRTVVSATLDEGSRNGIKPAAGSGSFAYVTDDEEHGTALELTWNCLGGKGSPYVVLPTTTSYKGVCVYSLDMKIGGTANLQRTIMDIKVKANGNDSWRSFFYITKEGYAAYCSSENTIIPTDVEIAKDRWYNYKLICNLTSGEYAVYVNNQYLASAVMKDSLAFDTFQYVNFSLQPRPLSEAAEITARIDNIQMDYYASPYTFTVSTVTENGETEGLEAFPMKGAMIKVTFSEAISELYDGAVQFVANGKDVEFDCKAAGNSLFIMPRQRLSPRAKCTLSFPGITTLLGGTAAHANKIDFSVSPADFSIASCSKADIGSDGSVTLDVKIQNKTQDENNAVLLCVFMRDNKMLSASSTAVRLLASSEKMYTLQTALPRDYNSSTDTVALYLARQDTLYALDELCNAFKN